MFGSRAKVDEALRARRKTEDSILDIALVEWERRRDERVSCEELTTRVGVWSIDACVRICLTSQC